MAKYLLDTTVLVDLLRIRKGRDTLFTSLALEGHHFYTSAINIAEVYGGMRSGEEKRTDQLLRALDGIPVTPEIAMMAGTLKSDMARKGKTFSLPDMIVAATAISHGLTLITDNVKDFAVPGVVLYPLP